MWFASGTPQPALVTASPGGTSRANAGVLGVPGTTVLAGNGTDQFGLLSGFRVRGGYWFDEGQTCGLDGSFFFLGQGSNTNSFSSPGSPIYSRPYIDGSTGLPAAELVSYPGILAGGVTTRDTLNFIGGDINLRNNLCCSCAGRVDLITGFQVLNLGETLTVTENLTALGGTPGVPAGTNIVVMDRFSTQNTFYGGQVGLAGEWWAGRWSVGARAAVGLGVVHSTVNIDGSTTITPPGGPSVVHEGGLLALPSNIGSYSTNSFGVAPSAAVNFGYQVSDHIRLIAGYSFLYLNSVARPGNQIDPVINTQQIPPATGTGTQPAGGVRTSDFWVQGVNLGMQFRY
ncbi:hypothetical protein FRUB_01087 [Fimbriiglobus ruber]|uniref:Uncharacterized protein n=2 Tax=Fimbriiglobus ruber TaxID=1908690 RepID=A0A225E9H4_9BACT|nr:hypothetical protein FRUB_01087 [Fimbriiglobus ruber]